MIEWGANSVNWLVTGDENKRKQACVNLVGSYTAAICNMEADWARSYH